MFLWDLASGRKVLEAPSKLGIGRPENSPGNAAFSRDGRWLALGGLGVQIWNLDSRERLLEVPTLSFGYRPPSFARDGTMVAIPTAHSLTLVNLADLADPRELSGFPGYQIFSTATDIEFSPDGARIAATSLGTIRVSDVETRAYTDLGSQLGPVTALAWSPDSRSLATGGADGSVRLWNVQLRREMLTIPTGSAAVVDLAFTSDGGKLAVASDNGTVSLNVIELEDLIEFARDRVSRQFTDEECQRYLHVPNCLT
jgi:WD40 repeat protein